VAIFIPFFVVNTANFSWQKQFFHSCPVLNVFIIYTSKQIDAQYMTEMLQKCDKSVAKGGILTSALFGSVKNRQIGGFYFRNKCVYEDI